MTAEKLGVTTVLSLGDWWAAMMAASRVDLRADMMAEWTVVEKDAKKAVLSAASTADV